MKQCCTYVPLVGDGGASNKGQQIKCVVILSTFIFFLRLLTYMESVWHYQLLLESENSDRYNVHVKKSLLYLQLNRSVLILKRKKNIRT